MERRGSARGGGGSRGLTPPPNLPDWVIQSGIADLLRDLPPETENFDFQDEEEDEFSKGYGSDEQLLEEEDEEGLDSVSVIPMPLAKGKEKVVPPTNNDGSPFCSQWKCSKLSVGGKLIPFLKTLGIYFLVFIPEDRPSWYATAVKCLPILSLALFVVLQGVSHPEYHRFNRRILAGLLFSCVGDAFLIWPGFFFHGLVAFGVAQITYIWAFGFQPLSPVLGAWIYIFGSSVLFLIGPGVISESLILSVGVFLYSSCLLGMVWRASARLLREEEDLWSSTCGVVGSISFLCSDTVLSLNRFYAPIPYHQLIIMITYYLAQLSIALSILRPNKPHVKNY